MTASRRPSKPAWKDVKAKLAGFDQAGLISLLKDLYAADKKNQVFLHTRLGVGEYVLKPYKDTLARWLRPDVLRNQDISLAKAKEAVSSYRKAIGDPAGLAELSVFFCENAAGFTDEFGYEDESFFNALVSMFEQALKLAPELPVADHDDLIARLGGVRRMSHNWGYGVSDVLDGLLDDFLIT